MYIKQYGIQRSGTNFMRAVFELNTNTRVLANIGGYKHDVISNVTIPEQVITEISTQEIARIDKMLQENKIPRIVIIRSPYSWIPSIARYLEQKISISFIEEQLSRYSFLNSHWANKCDYIIYFEDIIRCPEKILDDYAGKIGFKVNNNIKIPRKMMERGGDVPAKENISPVPFNIDYLLKEKYLDKMTPDEIKYIQKKETNMNFLKR